MRNTISAIALLASCTAASAGDSVALSANDDARVFGLGAESCAAWMGGSGVKKVLTENWILGFWSGVNVGNPVSRDVGSGTDSAGIVGEVRLYCTKHPSVLVARAAAEVYIQLANKEAGKK